MRVLRDCSFIIVLVFASFIAFGQDASITMATTTSTENSGLLSVLIPPFEEKTGIRVDVISVGTGAAIRLAENGDVDLILVHAPAAEERFVEAGFGVNRRSVMHNDFVLLGPSSDPAEIRGMEFASSALKKISTSGEVSFISRGDDSGTHKKELSIWSSAGIEPKGRWYKEAGQGMGAVLNLSSEIGGYTLSDRGTYISQRSQISLDVLVEGDPLLYNPYSVIAVNPAVHRHVKYESAMRLIAWMTSPEGQEIIGSYTMQGEVLFYPDAVP